MPYMRHVKTVEEHLRKVVASQYELKSSIIREGACYFPPSLKHVQNNVAR
jgi:hypothetical protein